MRRIPRPRRAIDPSLLLTSVPRPQLTPVLSLRVASASPHLRTTSASFSTTPTLCFILGKQDKKTHQAFVRRWQKRLLGDSEPIGARVDPYDPTSPVRIAPEEQGEEMEVLTEDGAPTTGFYEEAENWRGLKHIGGEQWMEQVEESKLATEFEKLTMRTYTPLDVKMALQIEELTGSMYTLRDQNLKMAMAFQKFTGKPYTEWSFGRRTRSRTPDAIRENFHRAVTEVYALKQAGKDLDVSKLPNHGIYNAPSWIKDAKLQVNGNNFTVSLPEKGSLDNLLEAMLRVPRLEPELHQAAEPEAMVNADADVVQEEPPPPVMDPETPAFKRAALVKQDEEKRFDFMSNRPIPRNPLGTPAVQPTVPEGEVTADTQSKSTAEDKVTTQETVVEAVVAPTAAQSTIEKLEASSVASAESVAVLRQAVRDVIATTSGRPDDRAPHAQAEVKWRDVPLTDTDMKFALSKRVTQLTGLYITDPKLNAASTLGDLYHHFCAAAKPEVSKVYKFIHVEGARENHKAKQIAEPQPAPAKMPRARPTVGELLKLGNVEVHSKRPTAEDERRRIGLHKAIGREFRKRGLLEGARRRPKGLPKWKRTGIVEGTHAVPQPGTVVALGAAHVLKERTTRRKRELLEG